MDRAKAAGRPIDKVLNKMITLIRDIMKDNIVIFSNFLPFGPVNLRTRARQGTHAFPRTAFLRFFGPLHPPPACQLIQVFMQDTL
jgi:hypothetical protein